MTADRIYTEQLRAAYDHVAQADSAVRAAMLAPTADQIAAAATARAKLNAALEILEEVAK